MGGDDVYMLPLLVRILVGHAIYWHDGTVSSLRPTTSLIWNHTVRILVAINGPGPVIQRLYLTRVLAPVEGDAHFPEHDDEQWKLIATEAHGADEKNDYPHWYEVYERTPP